MRLNRIKGLLIFITLLSLFACRINPSIMMKTGKDYKFDASPTDKTPEYKITIHDIIEFKLFTNDGTKLIDLTAISGNDRLSNSRNLDYLVEFDGFCKLPIIGRTEVNNKTIREVENLLQEKYSKYYVKPFVQLKVLNRRVTVFPGGSSKAQVITLKNENVTILEALGQVGGLTVDAKAHKIKLVRGDLKNPQVFMFDFSTIEGIKEADFVLQANDIIYVEQRQNAVRAIVREIVPIVSLLTSTITLILVLNNLK